MSAIVLAGTTLKATLTFDGPIAPTTMDSPLELFTLSETFHSRADGVLRYSQVIDFEHLAPAPEEEEEEQYEDDDEGPVDPNDPDAAENRKARRDKQRKKFMEAKEKRDRRKMEVQNKIREDGEPFVYTTKVATSGWYRMCVHATWYQVGQDHPWTKARMLTKASNCGFLFVYCNFSCTDIGRDGYEEGE